jgi:pyruvate/2-oxoglutarate dehydrogenase complex dihydrolipoamide dehydrogenase (E3) component
MSSTNSATLATPYHIKGVNYSISSACSTSAHCIGNAAELIQWGKQDIVFAGGGEELDWTLTVLFDAMPALSSGYNDTPEKASRAYDKNRDGFVIAGGGDSAVDWAMSLPEVAAKVYVVHRRDKFRAAPDSVARMHAWAETGKLEMVVPFQLAGLEGTDGALEAVIVKDLDGNERRLEADVLLPFFGLAAKLGPIADWGFPVEKHTIPVDPATCQTPVDGLFAIGDVASYPGKLKLILQGFSDAAQAAHAIFPLVFPGEALHFEHSTTKGVPEL